MCSTVYELACMNKEVQTPKYYVGIKSGGVLTFFKFKLVRFSEYPAGFSSDIDAIFGLKKMLFQC